MKLSRISFLISAWAGLAACLGSTLYEAEPISQEGVGQSVKMVWTAQYDNPQQIKEKWPQYYKKAIKGPDPNARPLGLMFSDESRFHVAFRGTLGIELFISSVAQDEFPLLDLFKTEIHGHVHKGYATAYTQFRNQLFSEVTAYKEKHKDVTPVTLSGYSMGGAFAMLAALDLGLTFKDTIKLTVLTYGSANIFNTDGQEFYQDRLGQHHIGFLAEEDSIAHLSDISKQGVGKAISFSAKDSQNYNTRVTKKQYTDLDSVTASLVKLMISPPDWEAHAFKTYYDMAPQKVGKGV